VTPQLFNIFDIAKSSSYSGKSLGEKINIGKFSRERPQGLSYITARFSSVKRERRLEIGINVKKLSAVKS